MQLVTVTMQDHHGMEDEINFSQVVNFFQVIEHLQNPLRVVQCHLFYHQAIKWKLTVWRASNIVINERYDDILNLWVKDTTQGPLSSVQHFVICAKYVCRLPWWIVEVKSQTKLKYLKLMLLLSKFSNPSSWWIFNTDYIINRVY